MPSGKTAPARRVEQILLWIVIGLFLVLSIAWNVYPRIYYRYHPAPPPWPGQPESFGISNAALCFWFGCFLALLGFLQIRLSCRSHRGSSEVLFWLFLLFGFGAAVGAWIFAVANHFWTLTDKMLLLHQHRAMKIGETFATYGLRSALGAGLLNLGISAFRRRNSSSVSDSSQNR